MSRYPLINLVVFCLFTIFFSFEGTVLAAEFSSVNKNGAIIRSGPDSKAEALWEVFRGFPLEVVQKQKKWAKVIDFEGASGWIASQDLASTKTMIVKVKTATMRIGPSINYEEIALVRYGVVFEPLAKEGEWFKIRHAEGATGWIHSDLIWPSTP